MFMNIQYQNNRVFTWLGRFCFVLFVCLFVVGVFFGGVLFNMHVSSSSIVLYFPYSLIRTHFACVEVLFPYFVWRVCKKNITFCCCCLFCFCFVFIDLVAIKHWQTGKSQKILKQSCKHLFILTELPIIWLIIGSNNIFNIEVNGALGIHVIVQRKIGIGFGSALII